MKTNSQFKFPYFLVGIALGAIAALLLTPSPGEETWKYLRERSNKGLDYLNQQAGKLRRSAEGVIRKGRKSSALIATPSIPLRKLKSRLIGKKGEKRWGDRYNTSGKNIEVRSRR